MSPHLSQLNVAMAHRNYFRRNNLQILKLAKYTKIEYHYSRCKLATFYIGKDCQMFIFYCLPKTKFYSFVMRRKKKNLWPIWWYNRGSFPLGNKYFGVFVLNGLRVGGNLGKHSSFMSPIHSSGQLPQRTSHQTPRNRVVFNGMATHK